MAGMGWVGLALLLGWRYLLGKEPRSLVEGGSGRFWEGFGAVHQG